MAKDQMQSWAFSTGQCFSLNHLLMSSTASLTEGEGGAKPPGMRPVRPERRAGEARIQFLRGFIVSVFFTIILGGSLLAGGVAIFRALLASQRPPEAQVSRVTQPLLDGTFCRYTVFDSATTRIIEEKIARCDSRAEAKSKRGSRSTFSWGGR